MTVTGNAAAHKLVVSFPGAVTFPGSITTIGNASIGGNLSVTGTITSGTNVTINGYGNVRSLITINNLDTNSANYDTIQGFARNGNYTGGIAQPTQTTTSFNTSSICTQTTGWRP